MGFIDHFSEAAALYATIRPRYPRALFEFIAGAAPATTRAWDCATGNGQAALGLAGFFAEVEATDASAAQIEHALHAPRVRYRVQAAEATDFAAASFDAVCVAQALHWLDTAAFFREVRRVLRPGGVFAAWGYSWFSVDPEFDDAFARCVLEPIRASWPAQNRLVWDGYRAVDFPFARIETPEFAIEASWDFNELLAFVHSWSGTRRHIASAGRDFFDRAETRLAPLWGDPRTRRRLMMPISLVACRV